MLNKQNCGRKLCLVVLLLSVTSFVAGPASAYYTESRANHNGSTMVVSNNDGNITIEYERPKSSMRRQGVRNGTMLFEGTISGNRLNGVARVFRRGCAPAEYNVTGRWNVGTGQLSLQGSAPMRVRGGCRVVRYSNSSSNAYLLFNITGGGDVDHGGVQGAARPATCGWYIVLTCHGNRSAARRSLNDLGGEGVGGQAGAKVINTNNFSGFNNGHYCVADGPYGSQGEAGSIAWNEAVPGAYVKKGC